MGLIMVLAIVVIIGLTLEARERLEGIFFIMFVGLILIGLGGIAESGKIDFKMEEIKVEEIEIKALKDNRNVEGDFFLGSGTVQEEDYYYYMIENPKGFEMKKVKTASAYVNEVEDGNYKIETYKLVGKSPFVKFFFGFIVESEEYIFHVPANSVQRDFKVDME